MNWSMWISGLFPIVFIILGTGLVHSSRTNKTVSEDDFCYGRTGKRGVFERRIINFENVISAMETLCLWSVIYLFSVGLLELIPALQESCEEISNEINQLPEIMSAIWLAVLGILVVFVSFSKRHWLTFDSRDILKYFGVEKTMLRMLRETIVACFISVCSLILSPKAFGTWYYALIIINVVLFSWFIFQFWRLGSICVRCFLGDRMESIFIDKLYQELWVHPMKQVDEEWTNDSVDGYLEYLCESFRLSSRKINKSGSVSKVTYFSNVVKGEDEIQRKRFKRLSRRSLCAFLGGVFGWVTLMVVTTVVAVGISAIEIGIGIIILLVTIGWLIIWRQDLVVFAIILLYGRVGYEISYKKGRRYVCLEKGLRFTRQFKYVRDLKNMVTFGVLAIEAGKEKTIKHIIERYKKEALEYPQFFIPIIVLDYLFYMKNNGEFLLEDISVPNQENYIINFVRPFALDIERSINIQGVNPNRFEDYRKARLQNKKKQVK